MATIKNGVLTQQGGRSELPPRPAAKNRLCPTARSCLPGVLFDDFNPFTARHDGPTLRRRLYASSILLIRIAVSVLLCFNLLRAKLITWFIVEIILGILGIICIIWALHLLMNVQGHRRAMGKWMGQKEFDWFLLSMLLSHLLLIALSIFGKTRVVGQTVWILLFVLIWLAAWVSTWSAEGTSGVV